MNPHCSYKHISHDFPPTIPGAVKDQALNLGTWGREVMSMNTLLCVKSGTNENNLVAAYREKDTQSFFLFPL